MHNFDRKNFVSGIEEVTGYNVCGKHEAFHVCSGKFYHKVFVAYFYLSKSGTVDNRSHAHYFAFVIFKNRVFLEVFEYIAVVFSLWMGFKNFTACLFGFSLQRNKTYLVGIGCGVVNRPLYVCSTVDAH